MSDRLTQLQDCLDQLLVQMYATLHYLDTRHSPSSIPGQTDQFTPPTDSQATAVAATQGTATQINTQQLLGGSGTQNATQATTTAPSEAENLPPTTTHPRPDPPALFEARMHELARDLVLKEQQIEVIIASLPGIGNSQVAQEKRLRALNRELKAVEKERDEWRDEWRRLKGRVEGLIGDGVRRV